MRFTRLRVRFNPLFIGAWVRTICDTTRIPMRLLRFQSPLHRGLGSDLFQKTKFFFIIQSFNPLFIGAWVRTFRLGRYKEFELSFNPLFIGAWVRTRIPSIYS